jgi:thiamine pyrophosphokinase
MNKYVGNSIIPRILVYYYIRNNKMVGQLGIVFTGGEGPAPETLKRIMNSSLATGALLAAADSGLHLAEAAGMKPHWIIGDMDSLDSGERLRAYPAERIIRHPADKDFTDTELAITLLQEKGCGDVWIIGGGGGRTDHLFGIRELFEKEQYPRRWITAAEDIHCIDGTDVSGGCITQTLEPGAVVSVFPLGCGPWTAKSRGLKWPLDNVRWERGMTGLSNVAVSEQIEINAIKGRFMIIFLTMEEI